MRDEAPNPVRSPGMKFLRPPVGGDGGWLMRVLGGFTGAQRLMTLTGESPTSSDSTLAAGAVTPTDKETKRVAHAAVRCAPARTQRLGDGSSSGVAATVAKGRTNGRMNNVGGP